MDTQKITTNGTTFTVGQEVRVSGHGWCDAIGTITQIHPQGYYVAVRRRGGYSDAWIPTTSLREYTDEKNEEHLNKIESFLQNRIKSKSATKPGWWIGLNTPKAEMGGYKAALALTRLIKGMQKRDHDIETAKEAHDAMMELFNAFPMDQIKEGDVK